MLVLIVSQHILCKITNHCYAANCWVTCEPVSVHSCSQHHHTLLEAAELATNASLPESVTTPTALLAIALHSETRIGTNGDCTVGGNTTQNAH